MFTVSPERSSREELGSVVIHRVKPRIPLNYYPGLYLDLVPLDDTVLKSARDREFDVVHVATPGHIGITGLYFAKKMATPVIGSYHTELPQYVSQRLLGHLDDSLEDDEDARQYVKEVSSQLAWDFLACFYNHCEKVLVPSEATREVVKSQFRVPLELFQRGVDTDLFTPTLRQRTDDKLRLLYVGRLAIEKNLGWLVEFGQRHPEVELVFVGDGPQRAELETALPRARFTGTLHGAELTTEYASADLFAFPSKTETFGNVVLEAQASGLPAVVSNRGGPQEIVEPGHTGLVASNAAEFEQHLLGLINDPAHRAAMSRAARGRAEQRSWEEVFERLLNQYRSVKYPPRRRRFLRVLQRLKDSDNPFAVGLVSFWKQFGRRREARAARERRPETS